jgi:hypothetical protein
LKRFVSNLSKLTIILDGWLIYAVSTTIAKILMDLIFLNLSHSDFLTRQTILSITDIIKTSYSGHEKNNSISGENLAICETFVC